MIIRELLAALGMEVDPTGFAEGEAAISKVKKAVGAFAEIAAGAAVGLAALVGGTAKAGEEASKTAQRVGVSTDAIQELDFAADQSGVGAEELNHALTHLSRSAYEASQGNLEAAKTFQTLGVHVLGANGKLKPTDELLGNVADAFAKMPDGVKKTALSMLALSRSGSELIPFLNNGARGIQMLREQAQEFGVVLDSDTISASREFMISLRMAEAALKGVAFAIAGPLLRPLGSLLGQFSSWVALNRKAFSKTFLEGLQGVGKALHVAWLAAGPLVSVFKALLGNADALKMVMYALTAAVFLYGLSAVGSALAGTLAWAASLKDVALAAIEATGEVGLLEAVTAAAPFLVAAAWGAFAVLVLLLLEDLYETVTTKNDTLFRAMERGIVAWWPGFKAKVLGYFTKLWDEAVWLAKDVGRDILDAIEGSLKGLAKDHPIAVNAVQGALNAVVPGSGMLLGAAANGGAGSLFGGGASPAASVASSPRAMVRDVKIDASTGDINVTAQPGQDTKAIGEEVQRRIDAHHERVMRETDASLGAY